ncbi:MAG: 50S ribosomal protein L11 methyltransferase [Clostridia bacterium]|nr:50S ribosomal protein L11 methyltransferase [Clostridia bacterium]
MEIVVSTTTPGSDLVSELLTQIGAEGTMVEDRSVVPDPNQPSGYWELIDPSLVDTMPEDVRVHAWLTPDASLGDRLTELKSRLRDLQAQSLPFDPGTLEVTCQSVEDPNWAEAWKKFYKPFRAGQRLVVKPSWEQWEKQDGDLIIEMDPGMAFGSGTHETTSLCLALLEDVVNASSRVIDVGCGSGILAIGAALLGARDVLATDIDPDAVRVARENIERNHLTDVIRAQAGNLLDNVSETCDVCVANIIADVIMSFASPLRAHIVPGGYFISSGIIRERGDEVQEALTQAGYEILRRVEKGEWVAFLSRNP